MGTRKAQSRRQSSAQLKRSQAGNSPEIPARGVPVHATKMRELDEQWLQEMRRMVRAISLQIDELELIFRAFSVLESKQAVRRWFNGIVPALGARPIDLCQTARGRRAVLRELGQIEHGVHS
jgi:uncharacterized protein (DUF2384 family)